MELIKFLSITTAGILLFLAMSNTVHAQDHEKGITIDIARKHYSIQTLKAIIDEISANGGNYLQLHFSDNENYAIASDFLGQNSENTNDTYLTKNELLSLINYSNDRNILVIPDIDLPSHSNGWLRLIEAKDRQLYDMIKTDYSDDTLDYHQNIEALNTANSLLKEVLELFYQPKFDGKQRIVLGGDEVPGSEAHQSDFIDFMNQIAKTAKQNNYQPQMWNDSITPDGIPQLDRSYSILYWQQRTLSDGGESLTVEDFEKWGFSVYNYNAYSLYFLPSARFTQEDIAEQIDYMSWAYAYNKFYYLSDYYQTVDTANIKGAGLTFWGEDAGDLNQEQLLEQELPLIRSFLQS
ncbi:family 20 glycosylhydrolase [Terribacillus saccharophilus]|uniref:family 20 glycosylhydrolase n=1 Tax=Terribacillus saccharophilus TaxID=361277 RepID=UPI003982391B